MHGNINTYVTIYYVGTYILQYALALGDSVCILSRLCPSYR